MNSKSLLCEEILSKITLKELNDKFSRFEKNQSQNDEDCILEAIMIGSEASTFKAEYAGLQKNGILFRARKLKREEFNPDTLTHDDFWEAPKEYIDYGRLNKPEEQFLYLAKDDPMTAIKEVGIENNDYFLLTCYKIIDPLQVLGIGTCNDFKCGLSEESKVKLCALTDFIERTFLKNGKSAYVFSNIIAKIFDFGRDGWMYPSVAHQNGLNLCLKLSAKSNLEIHSSYFFKGESALSDPEFVITVSDEIKVYNDWSSESSEADKIRKSLFTHIEINNELNKNEQPKIIKDIDYPVKLAMNRF